MPQPIEFQKFPSIPRVYKLHMMVTEKIDGTNAQIFVPDDPAEPLLAGSRNRWLTPESDNFGFASWVRDNQEALRNLGPGRHFGEWFGLGIQRGYGLDHKRFALFNTRQDLAGLPDNVCKVPLLYIGEFDLDYAKDCFTILLVNGSTLVPGYPKPEGIVVSGDVRFKLTDNGDQHKGAVSEPPSD